MKRPIRLSSVVVWAGSVLIGILVAAHARADEAFYRVPIDELKFADGELPAELPEPRRRSLGDPQRPQPRAVVDGEGEAYVYTLPGNNPQAKPVVPPQDLLVVRLAAPGKISGAIFWPNAETHGLVKRTFVIEAEPSERAKDEFWAAKKHHYANLMNRGIAGTAWFRHQERAMRKDAGTPAEPEIGAANRQQNDAFDESFGLFSGGRAISGNLQLDRLLPPAGKESELVPLDTLEGIKVAEIDWKPLIKEMKPDADPLARVVPADQHLVLFPSFSAFAQVSDRLVQHGTVVMHLAQPQTGDPRLMARYQQQLGLSLQGAGRIVGPQVIDSVALTGSDPYFRSGTDIALAFETAQPEVLADLLWTQVVGKTSATPSAKKIEGKVGGLSYRGMRSLDRQISSYVFALAGAVVVTNSPYQIERFAAVADGRAPAVTSLNEFTYFRNRYPHGDKEESALLFISDATIRRWCGPRWRIAASREIRAAAVLAELQAGGLDKLVKKQVAVGPLATDLPWTGGGELTLSAEGVQSSTYGNLAFMTPIAELHFDEVTQAEADAYSRWRDGYQSNWRWAFDPIALRLTVGDHHLAADLTVTPLIASNDYRRWIDVSRGATISAEAGDRHNSIVQLIVAINAKNEMVGEYGNLLRGLIPGAKRDDPLSWFGQSVSLYVDYDTFWNDLAECKNMEERFKFVMDNVGRIPVALWLEVADGPALQEFLVAARASVEKNVPGGTEWESLDYLGQPYTKITYGRKPISVWQLFHFASDKFILVTPNEAMVKRAIHRQVALDAAAKGKAKPAAADDSSSPRRELQPWLGTNVGFQVDHKLFALLMDSFGENYQQWMQTQSWSNLPILNEWRGLYPNEDPVALHERIWHTRLVCPGGGQYVWNEAWQTMESTAYGHPGEPKIGPGAPPELLDFRFANFGLSFEGAGLRARLTLDQKPSAGKTEKAKP